MNSITVFKYLYDLLYFIKGNLNLILPGATHHVRSLKNRWPPVRFVFRIRCHRRKSSIHHILSTNFVHIASRVFRAYPPMARMVRLDGILGAISFKWCCCGLLRAACLIKSDNACMEAPFLKNPLISISFSEKRQVLSFPSAVSLKRLQVSQKCLLSGAMKPTLPGAPGKE